MWSFICWEKKWDFGNSKEVKGKCATQHLVGMLKRKYIFVKKEEKTNFLVEFEVKNEYYSKGRWFHSDLKLFS